MSMKNHSIPTTLALLLETTFTLRLLLALRNFNFRRSNAYAYEMRPPLSANKGIVVVLTKKTLFFFGPREIARFTSHSHGNSRSYPHPDMRGFLAADVDTVS